MADIDTFLRFGLTIVEDHNCPPDRVYLYSERKHHEVIVHEGPDAGKTITIWDETEEEWAKRCGTMTNIGHPKEDQKHE